MHDCRDQLIVEQSLPYQTLSRWLDTQLHPTHLTITNSFISSPLPHAPLSGPPTPHCSTHCSSHSPRLLHEPVPLSTPLTTSVLRPLSQLLQLQSPRLSTLLIPYFPLSSLIFGCSSPSGSIVKYLISLAIHEGPDAHWTFCSGLWHGLVIYVHEVSK